MKKTNRIIAMALGTLLINSAVSMPTFAATTNDSVTMVASSEMSINNNEVVEYYGHPCRLIDGEYVTEIDGEEYIVIGFGDSDSGISVYSFTPPFNVNEIDVSDGSEYRASVNLNLGDHKAIYNTGTSRPELSAYIRTGFWIPQTYHFEIYSYDDGLGWVLHYNNNLTLGNGRKYLFTGTGAYAFEKFAIKISAANSGQKRFNYWFGKA